MKNYGDMSLKEFQNALASKAPTPGGGSAAAVALGQAAALTSMVSELTLGSNKWSSGWVAAEAAKSVAAGLLARALELADADAAAFDAVMAAFRMPKSDEEKKASRIQSIRTATVGAAEVPLQTASSASELMGALVGLAEGGNSNALSDVEVAGLCCATACRGALANVLINLDSLPTDLAAPLRTDYDGVLNDFDRKEQKLKLALGQRSGE